LTSVILKVIMLKDYYRKGGKTYEIIT